MKHIKVVAKSTICRDKHKTEKIRDPAGKSESRKYVAAFDGAQRL